MPKADYEELRAEKQERLEELAKKKHKESGELWNQYKKMGDVIPFGQPILVGHHSENADRNYRNRIENKGQKAFDVGKVADYYDNRVNAMEHNGAISSDDPEAINKINAKIVKQQEQHAKVKKLRKEFRDNKEQKIKEIGDREYHRKYYLMEAYMVGYLAEIKRLQDRIKGLESQENIQEEKFEKDGVSFEVNKEINRVMIYFPGKPSEEIRSKLKHRGFRWSPRNMAWQAYIKQWNIDFAKEIVQG